MTSDQTEAQTGHLPLIQASFARPFTAALRSYGSDPDPMLRSFGLDNDIIRSTERSMPLNLMIDLINAGAKVCGDRDFGLTFGSLLEARFQGAFGMRLRYARDSSDAFAFISDNLKYVKQATSFEVTGAGESKTLKLEVTSSSVPKQNALLEAELVSLIKWMRDIHQKDWHPTVVHFMGSEDRAGPNLQSFLGRRIIFDSPFYGMEFSPRISQAKFSRHDPELCSVLEAVLRRQSADWPDWHNLLDAVRFEIQQSLMDGSVSVEKTAQRRGVSVRTLQRRLSEYGTSFSKVLTECRHELAARLLMNDALSVSQVAFELGYANVATFTRAFRSWHGVPPSAFANSKRR